MVTLDSSQCKCGRCGKILDISWEIDSVDSREKNMGSESYYSASTNVICPECGNEINCSIQFVEYPDGVLEVPPKVIEISDDRSELETPRVSFGDY
ncbi:hypothetical protein [Butyrivibrio sp. WCD2001]|uniref:hypothetical protein n=1 Tax=Butyrivibrio sp. WCD2001 TaxID=1280681 RepID=UPI0012DF699C|nr:hypothetical protein [Butyrivibrio sp. WCD2001]